MEKNNLRILLANEPRTYREVIADAFRVLRPLAEISAIEPDDLDDEVLRLDPHVIVYSRSAVEAPSYPPTWVLLYPDGNDWAEIFAFEERVTLLSVGLGDLLAVLDKTEALLSRNGWQYKIQEGEAS